MQMTKPFRPGDPVAVIWPSQQEALDKGIFGFVEAVRAAYCQVRMYDTTNRPDYSKFIRTDMLRHPVALPDHDNLAPRLQPGTPVVLLNRGGSHYGTRAKVHGEKFFGAGPNPGFHYSLRLRQRGGRVVCSHGTNFPIHFRPSDLALDGEPPKPKKPYWPTGRLRAIMETDHG